MRKFALALVFCLLAFTSLSFAKTCLCISASCNLTGNDSDWSGTNCDASPPIAGDIVTINAGGNLVINSASATVGNITVTAGGTIIKESSVQATTINFDSGIAKIMRGISAYAILDCQVGSNCQLSRTGETGPTSLVFTGSLATACGGGPCTAVPGIAVVAGNVGGNVSLTADAIFRLRGVQRASSTVASYWQGLGSPESPDDFTDCVKLATAPVGATIGDTAVFTTGRSRNWWYKVSGVGITTECATGTCGGVDCDLEITRNATGAGTGSSGETWKSLTAATGRTVANIRHATPTDANADGTFDAANTQPRVGDNLEVFTPAIVRGGATTNTQGISFVMGGVQADMRYVEFAELVTSSSDCTADGTSEAVQMEMIAVTSPEGSMDFINIHDFMSRQSNGFHRTDLATDNRANYPFSAKFWYIHESAPELETCNVGGVSTQAHLGGGMKMLIDNVANNEQQDNITLADFHFNRLSAPAFIGSTITGASTQLRAHSHRYSNFLVHDIPKNTTFPIEGGSPAISTNPMISLNCGADIELNGAAVWDINNTVAHYGILGIRPHCVINGASDVNHRNTQRVSNLFAVNVESLGVSRKGENPGSAGLIDLAFGDTATARRESQQSVLSNSYISNINGGIIGGSLQYNYIHNIAMSPAAAACSTLRTGAVFYPQVLNGNVIYRDIATSCYNAAVSFDQSAGTPQDCPYSNGTRKITNNVILLNLLGGATNMSNQGIHYRSYGVDTGDNCAFDIYNNYIDNFEYSDGTNNNSNGIFFEVAHADTSSPGFFPVMNAYYNIIGGATDTNNYGISWSNASSRSTLNHAKNRFFRVTQVNAILGTTFTNGLDSDGCTDSDKIDFVVNRLTPSTAYIPCDSPEYRRTSWGGPTGPLRYGINTFGSFHPSVIPTFNADVYKIRYNWQECGRSYQDAIPR